MKTGLAIAAYVLGAIVAFGHASNHVQPDPHFERESQQQFNKDVKTLAFTFLWPLYVSSVLFEETPK